MKRKENKHLLQLQASALWTIPLNVLMNAAILLYIVDGAHARRGVILASNIVPSNLTE